MASLILKKIFNGLEFFHHYTKKNNDLKRMFLITTTKQYMTCFLHNKDVKHLDVNLTCHRLLSSNPRLKGMNCFYDILRKMVWHRCCSYLGQTLFAKCSFLWPKRRGTRNPAESGMFKRKFTIISSLVWLQINNILFFCWSSGAPARLGSEYTIKVTARLHPTCTFNSTFVYNAKENGTIQKIKVCQFSILDMFTAKKKMEQWQYMKMCCSVHIQQQQSPFEMPSGNILQTDMKSC